MGYVMSDNKKFSKNDALNYLMSEDNENKSVVLLFDDSKAVRDFSDKLGSELRGQISTSMGVKYRVRQNMLQVGERKVFLGLKQDEELLLNNYDSEVVKHFGDEDA